MNKKYILILVIFLIIILAFAGYKWYKENNIIELPTIDGKSLILKKQNVFSHIYIYIPKAYQAKVGENDVIFTSTGNETFKIMQEEGIYKETELDNYVDSLVYYYEEKGLKDIEKTYFTNNGHVFGNIIYVEENIYHSLLYFIYNDSIYILEFTCTNDEQSGLKNVAKYIMETISFN